MRHAYLAGLFCAVFLVIPTDVARAAAWLEQISGNPQAITITRKGNFLKAAEMTRLQPGDIIKVMGDRAFVRILLGSGAIKNVSKANSPFTLAGQGAGGSFLSNLMGEVKNMLVASAEQTEAVALMTRGRKKALSILATGAEENYFLTASSPLLVGWQGGKAPYEVSLIHPDRDKPLASKAGLTAHQLSFDITKTAGTGLSAGEVQILVESRGGKSPASSEITLLLVEPGGLPKKAQKLLGLSLDKRVEARFLISLLRKLPQWRFFAYSLAVNHGFEKEQKLLRHMK